MVEMTSYTVVYERDDNMWLARVPAVPGCHTQGRTLAQAERRIREALSLWVDDAQSARLVNDVRLPRRATGALATYWAARIEYEQARHRVRHATWDAVHALAVDAQLGVRDTGDLVGLSSQRVQQVAASAPTPLIGEEDAMTLLASCAQNNRFVSTEIWVKSLANTTGQGFHVLGAAGVNPPSSLQAAATPLTLDRERSNTVSPMMNAPVLHRRSTDKMMLVEPRALQSTVAKRLQEVTP